ncbi:RNA ligase A protein [Rhizobium phage RHph_I1_18]|nr:RNA ligase A protein [Rhizobium phage RHph_I1_18]
MQHHFPKIEHIDDVRVAIQDHPEIVIARRVGFDVVNYVNVTSDTFRPPVVKDDGSYFYPQAEVIRRECRGLIFDQKTGKIIRRPFHKFFNLNERMETMDTVVDLTTASHLYRKLDGSMIAPFVTSDNVFRIGTKMGETEIADQVKDWVDIYWKHQCMWCIGEGITPIFEWMSPWNTVVIRHSEPKLTLIGLREMISGRYLDLHGPEADRYGFASIVDTFPNTSNGQAEIVSRVRDLVDEEGIVACWDDGSRVKVKGDWYTAIHKVKDNLLYERNVVSLILNEQLDDVMPYLDEIDRKRLALYQDDLYDLLYTKAENVAETVWRAIHEQKLDKKGFALGAAKTLGPFAGIGFRLFDLGLDINDDGREKAEAAVKEMMLKMSISNSKWADFKQAAKVKNGTLVW